MRTHVEGVPGEISFLIALQGIDNANTTLNPIVIFYDT